MTSAGRAIARLCWRRGNYGEKALVVRARISPMSGKMTRADELSCFSSAFRSGILFEKSEACLAESRRCPGANRITARREAGTSTKKQNLARKARSPAASICEGRVQPPGKACTETAFQARIVRRPGWTALHGRRDRSSNARVGGARGAIPLFSGHPPTAAAARLERIIVSWRSPCS